MEGSDENFISCFVEVDGSVWLHVPNDFPDTLVQPGIIRNSTVRNLASTRRGG